VYEAKNKTHNKAKLDCESFVLPCFKITSTINHTLLNAFLIPKPTYCENTRTMPGKKKNVMFAFDEALVAKVVCYLPTREEYEPGHLEELYYTRPEFQAQRASAKADSREMKNNGLSKKLDDVFSEKNKSAQECLEIWTLKGAAARGLERWANKEHGEKRQQEQFASIMAVLQAQDDMHYSRCPVDPDHLRRVSYKKTRQARHFARMMGKADAVAVGINTADNSSLAGMSALSIDSSGKRCGSSDDMSVAASSSSPVDVFSVPSLDDDSIDIDLPKKRKDGKRRFRFGGRRKSGKSTPELVNVHSRA
jgi:hypothetical protein